MRTLSKSKLLAYLQCPKRVWLEVHQPELRQDSADSQQRFAAGHRVGAVAQAIYDLAGCGTLIEPHVIGYDEALRLTASLLASHRPIFEAAFKANGVFAMADVILPDGEAWRMVEIKSTTSVKDYHRDDVAVQAYVATSAGVPLSRVALGHIDNTWVYQGDDQYNGLFVEADLTDEARARRAEVAAWVQDAQCIVAEPSAPKIRTGRQCRAPYECGFFAHCRSCEPEPQHPAEWLPRPSPKLSYLIEVEGVTEMAEVPDVLLTPLQRRVRDCTLNGQTFFDQHGAQAALAGHGLPAHFLDFETISHVVPVWKGFRPNQVAPFQFSVHRVGEDGAIKNEGFLDLFGRDPSEACAEALVAACGSVGPVYVYNQAFEKRVLKELAERVPNHAEGLMRIHDRVVDLLPIARDHYYHPSQQGSWSIKAVLPAMFHELRYDALGGVKDGGMAMAAYIEATDPKTTAERRQAIATELSRYCALDTWATVKLWAFFLGRELNE
ncbi:DUF2779 domain-containing protein [Stenotrophomonas koreensis]|uniref:DUF2779 domain-containing protein n=1 Tax=Stenotrophomonas koreensis TaxID=266128 RepID=UPI003396907C